MQSISDSVYIEDHYLGATLGVIQQPRGLVQVDAPPAPEDGRAWRAALMGTRLGTGTRAHQPRRASRPDARRAHHGLHRDRPRKDRRGFPRAPDHIQSAGKRNRFGLGNYSRTRHGAMGAAGDFFYGSNDLALGREADHPRTTSGAVVGRDLGDCAGRQGGVPGRCRP